MKQEVREALERPFSADQIKQRQGNYGATLDYIEGHEIIQRLNEAFDGDWSFEIVWRDIRDEEVLVSGRLTAAEVTKEQFGSSKISKHKETGIVISLGDDLKAAATDALKKCATLLGVGLHLYRNDQTSASPSNGTRTPSRPNRNRNTERPHDDDGHNGNGNGRATPKQVKAIFAIAQDKGMTNKEIRDFCVDNYGKVPDYLSKDEASSIIQDLSAR